MATPLRKLAFSVLAVAALVTLSPPSAHAAITRSCLGSTMAAACNCAVAEIEDTCDNHPTITTDPGLCRAVYLPPHEFVGYICDCTATTPWCAVLIPPGLPNPAGANGLPH
jgi:hypothetical protein